MSTHINAADVINISINQNRIRVIPTQKLISCNVLNLVNNWTTLRNVKNFQIYRIDDGSASAMYTFELVQQMFKIKNEQLPKELHQFFYPVTTPSTAKHDDFKKETTIMTTNQLINLYEQKSNNGLVKTVEAREIHKFLESKREFAHWVKDRIEQFEFIENEDFIRVDNFVKRGHNSNLGTKTKDYYFTLSAAKELAMVENNAKGKEARKYFIECEKKALSPTSALPNFADPAAAAIAWAAEYKEKERMQLELKQIETQIIEDKPYTKLGKIMTMVEATIMIGEYAIMLQNNHKIKIGQNRLFEWLRENGYLCKDGKFKNRPTQKSMELELFAWTERVITTNHGEEIISFIPRITGKGQAYFIDKLTKDFSPDAA